MGGGDWIDTAQQVAQDIIVKTPDVVVEIKDEPNYWWMLTLSIIPVFVGWWLKNKGKK